MIPLDPVYPAALIAAFNERAEELVDGSRIITWGHVARSLDHNLRLNQAEPDAISAHNLMKHVAYWAELWEKRES